MEDDLFIAGMGAVSAAGIGCEALLAACQISSRLPVSSIGKSELPGRTVDPVLIRGALPKHPRFRRAGKVSKLAVVAGLEAIPKEEQLRIQAGERRLGIVATFLNGGVSYSNRFFGEVLDDPAFASPMIFPETVFNATPSHLAAYLGADGPSYTLLGDSATWFAGFEVARDWLSADLVDACLLVSAEELDPLSAAGLRLYSDQVIPTEGGAALYLQREPTGIHVENIAGPYGYTSTSERRLALEKAVAYLAEKSPDLLIDGLLGIEKLDRDEAAALVAYSGKTLSPAHFLGEGMGVRAGFQTIVALQSLRAECPRTAVLASGGNQQTFAATFGRNNS
jgi:hypothetical protein